MVQRSINLSKILGNSSAFLFGARGVGKTHLASEYVQTVLNAQGDEHVVTYDILKSEVYETFLKHPHQFRLELEHILKSHNKVLVFVDEVQRIPILLNEVHSLIESYKGRIRFLLSGSSARKLVRGGANLLAGRAISLRLYPLTDDEIDVPLVKLLQFGSLPGIILNNENPTHSLRSYVSTYLKEEIQQEAIVRRIDGFTRFLEVAAQYHCEFINASKISKYTLVSYKTVLEYFQILEDTLLGFKLFGWSASTTKQLRTTPKFYFFDNGVANALRGELNIYLKESSSRYGKLFEAWVIQQMYRINDYRALDLKFSYWRTSSDQEIDIIVSRGFGHPIAAIEIKAAVTPDITECSAFVGFSKDYPDVPKYCFCQTVNQYTQNEITFMNYRDGLALLSEL